MNRDLLIGSELAGYRIEALIGRGGMGSVYLAEQTALGRKVALKVLPPDLADSVDFRHRFERESRLAASLDHPHVVPIFESGEADGVLFIAMRLVEGTDLATLLADQGPLALDRAAAIVSQVGGALDAAHAKGLVHRDVKPGNILVVPGATDEDEEDYAYLSDFGLTRLTTSDSALTRTGHFMGTVAYAAPEQFQGRPADGASDRYSLGCVAYECVTGERPFPRDQEAAVMFAHLQEEPPHAAERRPGVGPALDATLVKAMAKSPNDRFTSGKAFGAALRAAVGTESSPGSTLTPPPVPPAPKGLASPASGRPPARRRLAVPAALVAVVVAAIAVIATQGGKDDPGATGPKRTASPSADVSASPAQSPSSTVVGAPPGVAIGVDTLARLDPDTGEVLATYPVGSNPQEVAASGGSVWVQNEDDVTISKLDIGSGLVTTRGGFPDPCSLHPAAGGGAWVGVCTLNQLDLVDPVSFEAVRSYDVPGAAGAVSTSGSVWVVSYRGSSDPSVLYRFTPSGRLETKVRLGKEAYRIVVTEDGALWGNDFGDGTIWRVDPATNAVEFIEGFTGVDDMIADGQYLWISDSQRKSVTQYDYVSRQTVGVVRDHKGNLALTPGAVWIQDSFGDTLTKVDRDSAQVLEEFQLDYSSDVASGGGSLWISAGSD